MGTTAKPAKEEKKKGGGGKKPGERKEKARGPHAGAGLPVPPPRLRAFYQEKVRPKLKLSPGPPSRGRAPAAPTQEESSGE